MFRPASAKVMSPTVGCASNGFGFKTPPPLIVPPEEGLAGALPQIGQLRDFRSGVPTRTGPGITTSYRREDDLLAGADPRIPPFGGFRPAPKGRTVPGIMTGSGNFGIYGLRGRRLAQLGEGLRFEVKDAILGNFIPNASVSLVFEDGTHIITKLTDAGGNVAFGEGELINAIEQAGLIGAEGVAWYTVEAPGYTMAEGMAWDPDIPGTEQLKKIYEIALQPAGPGTKVDPMTVAGLTTAGLLAIALL